MRLPLITTWILLTASSCGYVAAGRWNDDPQNWQRAFGAPLPPGWQVIHSRYARYPHFTYEGEYWFHVRVPEGDRSYLGRDLVRLPDDPPKTLGCDPVPTWFTPALDGKQQLWGSVIGGGSYLLAVHPNGRDIYFRDCQL